MCIGCVVQKKFCGGLMAHNMFTIISRTSFIMNFLFCCAKFSRAHGSLENSQQLTTVNYLMSIELIYLWRWIGTHNYSPMNSNIVEAFASRPLYMRYLLSRIQTVMAYHAGTLLTR